jgi:NADP-dependent 3-hydroxy acid dehydrogenase YdfG
MTTNNLSGKTCVVTGGGSGLGRALTLALVIEGAKVAICGREHGRLNETVALATSACGKSDMVLAMAADIRDRIQVLEFSDRVRRWAGPAEILVNNAATMLVGPVEPNAFEDYQEMVETNFLGVLSMVTAFMDGMTERKAGCIVNISSISSRLIGPGMTVYAATKCAVDAVSEGLRLELSPTGIRLINVQLGAVATPLNDKIRNAAMRRFIKARASKYTDMSPDFVAREIIHLLQIPSSMTAANVFLLPTDQMS